MHHFSSVIFPLCNYRKLWCLFLCYNLLNRCLCIKYSLDVIVRAWSCLMKLWISCVVYSNCSTQIMCVFAYPQTFLHHDFSSTAVIFDSWGCLTVLIFFFWTSKCICLGLLGWSLASNKAWGTIQYCSRKVDIFTPETFSHVTYHPFKCYSFCSLYQLLACPPLDFNFVLIHHGQIMRLNFYVLF